MTEIEASSGKVLATTKPYFKPYVLRRVWETIGETNDCAVCRRRQAKFGQKRLDKRLTPGAKLPSSPPTVPTGARRPLDAHRVPKAEFSALIRSVRSHENPPSGDGSRPKWP